MLKGLYLIVLAIVLGASAPSFAKEPSKNKYPREGDMVPDLVFSGPSLKAPIELKSLRGTVVLLNFWATWCPPCIEEMPSMDDLNKRFKAKPFTMIAVSIDENWASVEGFLKELNRAPTFAIAHDPNQKQANGVFGIEQYPESFLIDKKGVIRGYYQGAVNWTSKEILNKFSAILNEK